MEYIQGGHSLALSYIGAKTHAMVIMKVRIPSGGTAIILIEMFPEEDFDGIFDWSDIHQEIQRTHYLLPDEGHNVFILQPGRPCSTLFRARKMF